MSFLGTICPCLKAEEPPPRRKKIDRAMIGEPSNFVHTGHIGSGDMGGGASSALSEIQQRMESKGGYQANGTAAE
ncbi:CDC42 small effector protein 2-like [Sycon ciliatum]|uniref:CDC42 small effector protein 2-like n=1 Tax=Sycon ciliatum TaxID=27933 RepID=UPI0020ACF3AA